MLATWKENQFFYFQKCNETHDSWVTWVDWNEWWLMFKMSVILNQSVSTEQPKCSDEKKCKWQEIRLIITPTIVLIISHISNSVAKGNFRSLAQNSVELGPRYIPVSLLIMHITSTTGVCSNLRLRVALISDNFWFSTMSNYLIEITVYILVCWCAVVWYFFQIRQLLPHIQWRWLMKH